MEGPRLAAMATSRVAQREDPSSAEIDLDTRFGMLVDAEATAHDNRRRHPRAPRSQRSPPRAERSVEKTGALNVQGDHDGRTPHWRAQGGVDGSLPVGSGEPSTL